MQGRRHWGIGPRTTRRPARFPGRFRRRLHFSIATATLRALLWGLVSRNCCSVIHRSVFELGRWGCDCRVLHTAVSLTGKLRWSARSLTIQQRPSLKNAARKNCSFAQVAPIRTKNASDWKNLGEKNLGEKNSSDKIRKPHLLIYCVKFSHPLGLVKPCTLKNFGVHEYPRHVKSSFGLHTHFLLRRVSSSTGQLLNGTWK